MWHIVAHFVFRVICLIVVPVGIYLGLFYLHFAALNHTGEYDQMMSTAFQKTLIGNARCQKIYLDVGYGSFVVLKHMNVEGWNLRANYQTYPIGSGHQQVTCTNFIDANSSWTILAEAGVMPANSIAHVKQDSIIRLMNKGLGCLLRVEDFPAPQTPSGYLVTCLKQYGQTDKDNQWKVKIIEEKDPSKNLPGISNIRYQTTRFQLINVRFKCALSSHTDLNLPDWGFFQQEVACITDYNSSHGHFDSIWSVDGHEISSAGAPSPRLVEETDLRFFSKYLEVQKLMWKTNEDLTSPHPFQSYPLDWPFLERGIGYWGEERKSVYFIGNPLVWWIASTSIGLYVAIAFGVALRSKRGYPDRKHWYVQAFEKYGYLLIFGYLWHYLPFFRMRRQLFIYHYLSALYFSCVIGGVVFEFIFGRLKSEIRMASLFLILGAMAWAYSQFLPFSEGLDMTKAHCLGLKWRTSYDFECY